MASVVHGVGDALIACYKAARIFICLAVLLIGDAVAAVTSRFTSAASPPSNKKSDDASITPDAAPFSVCVIGGGIGGMGAAYGLARLSAAHSNDSPLGAVRITVLEPRPLLGGNAKTHEWEGHTTTTSARKAPVTGTTATATATNNNNNVRTGLSVLAWPPALFHNYAVLLRELRQEVDVVTPTFMVSEDGDRISWCHAAAGSALAVGPNAWAHEDMRRWDAGVRVARGIGTATAFVGICIHAIFVGLPCAVVGFVVAQVATTTSPSSESLPLRSKNIFDRLRDVQHSLYAFSLLNPLNVISLETWMRRVFGVSERFWRTVVVPVYSSSFLTCAFHELPAAICAPLDSIISVGIAEPLKCVHTWRGSSKDVFDAMQVAIERSPSGLLAFQLHGRRQRPDRSRF